MKKARGDAEQLFFVLFCLSISLSILEKPCLSSTHAVQRVGDGKEKPSYF